MSGKKTTWNYLTNLTHIKVKHCQTKQIRRKITKLKCSVSQLYYTLSIENKRAELIFLLSSGLSHLPNKFSFISNEDLLLPRAKMMKSSKGGDWSQNKKWSSLKLSTEGITLLKVNGGNTDVFSKSYLQVPVSLIIFMRTSSTTLKSIENRGQEIIR